MNKLSVFYQHICVAAEQSGLPVEDILKQVKECGIELLEISFDDHFLENVEKHKSVFDKIGMGVSCFCANFDLLHDSPTVSKEKYISVFKTAQLFNCDKVLCVPGFFNQGDNREEKMKILCEQLSLMCKAAQDYGICVTIEDFDNKNSPCCTTAQIKYLLDNVKGLTCTFDIGNFSYCSEDALKSYQILKEHINHVHLKDRIVSGAKPKNIPLAYQETIDKKAMYTTPTCEGELEIGKWIKQLISDGYNGDFVIEHFGLENQLSSIKKSAKNVMRILNTI